MHDLLYQNKNILSTIFRVMDKDSSGLYCFEFIYCVNETVVLHFYHVKKSAMSEIVLTFIVYLLASMFNKIMHK